MIRGIDIAVYQSDLDLARAKRLGAAFVICKATQDTWTDSAFSRQLRAGKAAGMVVGAYHFLIEPEAGGGAGPAAQAEAFVAACKAANGGTLDGLLLALDVEPYKPRTGPTSSPSWADVRTWVTRFRKLAGNDRPLFIYTRSGVWGSYHNPKIRPALGSRTYLWLADWTVPAGKAWRRGFGGLKATIHQHGPFPALRPRIVDGDAFAGTVAQLREYTHPKAEDPPAPDPTPDPVDPPMVDRWCLRLMGAPLLPGLGLDPVASVAFGAPLQVEAGPTGPGAADAGTPSAPWLVVRALAGRPVDPPLLVEAAAVGPDRPTLPAYTPSPSPSPQPPDGPPL